MKINLDGFKKVDWVNIGLGIAGAASFVLGIVQNKQEKSANDENIRKIAEEVFKSK